MTLPVSGAISFNNINVELGVAGTTQASLGQSSYRTLAGVASGAISMSNFYGKSNRAAISYTFSANTANASLNLSTISGYAAGTSDITVTINSGVYLYATSTGGYGLNLSGGTSGDTLTIVNNGYIMGMGGAGGNGTNSTRTGSTGGPAINFGFGMSGATITNTSGYIGGGGGGGGGVETYSGGGGGAGGGAGGYSFAESTVAGGGAGGGIGASGSNGTFGNYVSAEQTLGQGGAGGGGRVLPGTGGAGGTSGTGYTGKGGSAGGGGGSGQQTGSGGAGGSAGSAGSGPGGTGGGGGGGGWGASGAGAYASSGGSGGKAVNLNAKSITWTGGSSSSSRAYGAVS